MKNTHLLIGILLSIIMANLSFAQNPHWVFPNNNNDGQLIEIDNDFPIALPATDPLTSLTYTDIYGPNGGYNSSIYEMSHFGAANSITGPDGNLLFFIVGDNIFDYKGRTIWADPSNSDISTGKA